VAQSVNVSAANNISLLGAAGSLALSAGAGLAGGVDVGMVNNNTAAYIGNSAKVNANQDVSVNAFSTKDVDSYAISGSIGLAAGIAGSVSVYGIGSALDSDSRSSLNTQGGSDQANAQSFVDDQISSDKTLSLLDGYSTTDQPGDDNTAQVGTSIQSAKTSASSALPQNQTTAAVDATTVAAGTTAHIGDGVIVNADRNSDLKARENLEFDAIAGSGAAGFVGIGGSVVVANISDPVTAYMGTGATLTVGNILTQTATSNTTIDGDAYAGAAGLVGLGAQVVILNDTSSQSATIGNDVVINQAKQINITANSQQTVTADSMGGAIAGVAAGVAIARSSVSGTTTAELRNSVQVGQDPTQPVGDLSITAEGDISASANAKALAVGIGAGTGNDAKVTLAPTINAAIGDTAQISTTGSVNLNAIAQTDAVAHTYGVNAGGLAIGVSLSEATVTPTLNASIGSGTTLIADQSIGVNARHNVNSTGDLLSGNEVSATASSSGGGVLSGNGADARATMNPTLLAWVGDSTNLTAKENVNISANNINVLRADANGNSYGAAAVGASIAVASETAHITAATGSDARITAAGDVTIFANHNRNSQNQTSGSITANASSSTGGLVGGVGASATAQISSTIEAYTGDRSTTAAGQNVTIQARSGNLAEADAGGDSLGLAAMGTTTSNARITNIASAWVGAEASVDGDGVQILAESNNTVQKSEAIGGAGGVVAGASTKAIANVNDTTTATVNTDAQVQAAGTLTVDALARNNAHSNAEIETGAAVSFNQTTADTDVISQIKTTVGARAILFGNDVNLYARLMQLDADAYSYSKTYAADSTTDADALLNIDTDADIVVSEGAEVTATYKLNIEARQEGVETDSDAVAAIGAGVTGVVYAEGHNTLNLDSNVDVQADSKLSSSDVSIIAYAPHDDQNVYGRSADADADTIVNWVQRAFSVVERITGSNFFGWFVRWVTRTVWKWIEEILHSDEEATLSGTLSLKNAIQLNGDIYQGTASAKELTIADDLSLEGNVAAHLSSDGTAMVVDDIIGNPRGTVLLDATNGTVSGNTTIHKNSILKDVHIINNSDKDLRIGLIRPFNQDLTRPDLDLRCNYDPNGIVNYNLLTTEFVTDVVGVPTIRIENNSNSDVILAGMIENSTGNLAITNQGGNLLAIPDQVSQANTVSLNALNGNIGTTSDRIQLQLFEVTTDAATDYDATLGSNAGNDMNLAVQLRKNVEYDTGVTSETLLDGLQTNLTARRHIDVQLQAAQMIVPVFDEATYTVSLEPMNVWGRYHLNNLTSTTGNITVTSVDGDLYLDNASASGGTISLTTPGAIADTNGVATNLVAQSAMLSAGVGIGSSDDDLEANIERLEGIAGADGLWLHNTGALSIGGMSAINGLTSGGNLRLTNEGGSVIVQENITANTGLDVIVTDSSNSNETLWVNDGVAIATTTGTLNLFAGDDLYLATTSDLSTANQINLQADYGNADAGVGSIVELYGRMNGSAIALQTNTDDDIVSITQLATNATVQTRQGNDTIHVGSNAAASGNTGGILNNIGATLALYGGTGSDILTIDDSGDLDNNTGTLSSTRLSGLGMAGQIDYTNIEDLSLTLGQGNDILTVTSTHAGTTDISSNAGEDALNIQAIGGVTTVYAGTDNDVLTIGNLTQQVDDIDAALFVEGEDGNDTLVVQDSGDLDNNVGTLTTTTISGLDLLAPITYGTLETVDIHLGSGADQFTIASTHSGQTRLNTASGTDTVTVVAIHGDTSVNTGSEDDQIEVSNPGQCVDDIDAILTIAGDGGSDRLTISDAGDMTDNTGTLTATQLTGLGMGGRIDYATLEVLDLTLGSGADNFTVANTHTAQTFIQTASGDDAVIVQMTNGVTTIATDSGQDHVLVEDTGAATTIDTDTGSDTVLIYAIHGDATVRTGSEDDQITVSNTSQLLDNIDATLTIDGQMGADILWVRDTGDLTNNTGVLTATQLTGLGMGGYMNYANLEGLDIALGSGSDTFAIESTHANFTNLTTANGADAVRIESISGGTNLKTGLGQDVIRVGQNHHTVDGIAAHLTINGGLDLDALYLDDTGDVVGNHGMLRDTSITGLGMTGWIDYGAMEGVDIRLGTGADQFTIANTHSGQTRVDAGLGNDQIQVQAIQGATSVRGNLGNDAMLVSNSSQQLKDIAATLDLSGGLGMDYFVLDDRGNDTDGVGTVTDTRITEFNMPGLINYGTFEAMAVNLGTGSTKLDIESTHTGESIVTAGAGNDQIAIASVSGETTVKAGSGDDHIILGSATHTVDGFTAPLTVSGGLGTDALTVDGSGYLENSVGELMDTQISGMGIATPVNYGSLEAIALLLGQGSDQVTVTNTHAGQTFLNTGAGDDRVTIAAIAGATTLDLSSGNDALMLRNDAHTLGAIAANLVVKGGLGTDVMRLDDSQNLANTSTTLTDTRISGLGMGGSIDYGTLEGINLTTGQGHDQVTVASTASGQTFLTTNGGDDQVTVEAIQGPTTIDMGIGNDRVTISNAVQQVQGINSMLTIKGGLGTDGLVIDDSGDASTDSGTLSDTQISGLSMTGQINYGTVEYLDMRLGAGDNQLTIASTHAGQTQVSTASGNDRIQVSAITGATTIKAGSGDDAITISNSVHEVDGIAAALIVKGDLGFDTLTLDASGNLGNTSGTVSDTRLRGFGMGGSVDYGTVETVNVQLGSGSDTVAIASTASNSTTTLDTGAGDDVFLLEGPAEHTTLDGNVGEDVLHVFVPMLDPILLNLEEINSP
jgi:hypothetical protein